MKRKLFLLILFSICCGTISLKAQDQVGVVKGQIVNRKGRVPIEGAKVSIGQPKQTVETKADGSFIFENVNYGMQKITIEMNDFMSAEYNVRVEAPEVNVNAISLSEDFVQAAEDLDDLIEEFDVNDDAAMVRSSTLSASKDIYDQITSFNFSAMRFRNRGYENGSQDIYLNGVYMNDALTGNGAWSLWSGLNDATRNQEVAARLNAFEYGVGGVNGVTNINARASQMRKGFRSSAVTANGQYRARLMASYASGNLDNGWSFAIAASTRLGGNDYVKMTNYNSWAYFASVEKEINKKHRFAFTFFGSPTQREAQAAVTQEAYDLVDDNYYNPNWGYQNGKRRSARVRDNHEPVAMLNYFFTPNDMTTLSIAASYRFGKNGYSALDWYDAQDPKPDYHKNLPSYYDYKGEPDKAAQVALDWQNNTPHIEWDRLYDINYNSTNTWGEYNGVNLGSGRAKYILSERRTDQQDFNFNIKLSRIIDQYTKFYAGADFRHNRTEYFTKVKDLLGGKYWLNVDNFAERDFKDVNFVTLMNDMDNTNNLIAKKGDKYGYDYYAHIRTAKLWGILNINKGNWEGFAAGEIGYNKFWREGLYRKGIFPNDSKGNSEKQKFFSYTAKAGITYKPSGLQYISLSGVAIAKAPTFNDAFVSPRTRNHIVPNLTTEKTVGGDLTYSARFPFMKLRASGYYTVMQDQTKLISFYDDLQGTFTNFSMSGIDQRYMGLELGLEVPIVGGLSVQAGGSWGDYIYTSNPVFTQTTDNSATELLSNEKVYWKDYKVEGTPQLAATLGLKYRTDSYWFFEVNANHYQDIYLSMNPLYRTIYALEGRVTKDQVHEMVHQERLDKAFLLNASIGKSWYINRKYNFGFSLQVKNILNKQDIKTGGFEQMRLRSIDDEETRTSYYNRFDSKYFYLYGITYYLNIYFRF